MNITSKIEIELNRYRNLKKELSEIINILNNSIDNIDEASIFLDKFYLLDEESVDNKIFKNSMNEINTILDILNNTILPSIDAKINQLSNDKKEMVGI